MLLIGVCSNQRCIHTVGLLGLDFDNTFMDNADVLARLGDTLWNIQPFCDEFRLGHIFSMLMFYNGTPVNLPYIHGQYILQCRCV
jgi:hypothetical protein